MEYIDLDSSVEQVVFIVDDDPSICESLCDLIESAGLKARHFQSAEEFLAVCTPHLAGCLLLDVRLPGMGGMEMQGTLAKSGFAIPVIIMTAHGDMPMVRNAIKAGAIEFLMKPFQDDELLQAIQQAFAIDRAQRSVKNREKVIVERWKTLSDREQNILELVTAGMLNKQIAERLNLTLATVKMLRRQVMEKMQAESFPDLVKMWDRIKVPRTPAQ